MDNNVRGYGFGLNICGFGFCCGSDPLAGLARRFAARLGIGFWLHIAKVDLTVGAFLGDGAS